MSHTSMNFDNIFFNALDGSEASDGSETSDGSDAYSHEESKSNRVSMQILNGFIMALGIAAVAVAFLFLNVATLGLAGLITAVVGGALIFKGVFGLFPSNSSRQETVHLETSTSDCENLDAYEDCNDEKEIYQSSKPHNNR